MAGWPLITMALNLTKMAADLRHMIGGIPQSVTLVGVGPVAASVTLGEESEGLGLSDVTAERKLTAVIMAADCTARTPAENDVIRYSGQAYRITTVTPHDDALAVTIAAVGEFE
jgi:hypothetical protein